MKTNLLNNSELSSDQDMGTSTDDYAFCEHAMCSNCNQICKFRLSHLYNNNSMLTQKEVNDELKNHGHPSSRKHARSKKNRSKEEARSELRNNYKDFH